MWEIILVLNLDGNSGPNIVYNHFLGGPRRFEAGRFLAREGSKQVLVDFNWKSTTLTRAHLESFIAKNLPVSILLSIGLSFEVYNTSYVKLLRNEALGHSKKQEANTWSNVSNC